MKTLGQASTHKKYRESIEAAPLQCITRRVAVSDDANLLTVTNGTQAFANGDAVLLSSDGVLPADVQGPLVSRNFVINATATTLQIARKPDGDPINLVDGGKGIVRLHRACDLLEFCLADAALPSAYHGQANIWTPMLHGAMASCVSADVVFGIACNSEGLLFTDVDVQQRCHYGNLQPAKIHAGVGQIDDVPGERRVVLSIASEHHADAPLVCYGEVEVFSHGSTPAAAESSSGDIELRVLAAPMTSPNHAVHGNAMNAS